MLNRFRSVVVFAVLVLVMIPVAGQATVVRMQTSLGVVDLKLYDLQVRNTVTNFLNYVNRGAYNNSFIHRSVPNFVVQGGGYAWNTAGTQINAIPTDPPVDNEFSMLRPNVRGTVAMAKLGGNPDSATSQWFVNLVDNTTTLGVTNNGGFTVFGEVMANGMAVIDAIASLPRYTVRNSPFTELPLTSSTGVRPETMVMIKSATVLPTTAAATSEDRLFNYLEAEFFQYIAPASQPSGWAYGYYFRYYPDTSSCVGIKDGMLYYLGPASGGDLLELGSVDDWLATALAAGY